MPPAQASVGSWVSPITSKLLTAHSKRLGPVTINNGHVYWMEGRPAEKGRQVVVTRDGGEAVDVTPGPDSGFNVRTRVQEYGGGETVFSASSLYFSNFADQRLYVQDLQGAAASLPKPVTPESKLRYADGVVDHKHNRLIAVCEDHSSGGEPVTTVGAIDLGTGAVTTLVQGSDFYASPRLSPDGAELAYVSWEHPSMPWDNTTLWVAQLDDKGAVASQRKVAGGTDEAVMQPAWGPDGHLYFISDAPSGWWNIFRERDGKVESVFRMEGEVGGPAWQFGSQAYHVLRSGHVLIVYSDPKAAGAQLGLVDPQSGDVTPINTGFSSFGSQLAASEDGDRITVALVAGGALQPSGVVLLRAEGLEGLRGSKPEDWETLAVSTTLQVDPGYLSEPSVVEFPTEEGLTAFMNFYPPKNKARQGKARLRLLDYELPPGELPPLLVKIHGGPTSQASTAFSLAIQYWTSRGYAIADVNYGGSTGYGRPYRMRLRGQWGIVDVDDCCNAARHLVKQSLVDPQRLCISGGSAGGYTTLACLAFRDVFSSGASHYGVADLELLAKETHKFESRYLDRLIAPYPKGAEVYKQRSPINSLDKFSRPIAFFQGLEDEIVPPNQAELMYNQLKDRGIPTALVLFAGEQHGFRQATNIRRALDGELYFYGKTLGFPASMPDDLEPIDLANV
ncbi:hypothetical protein N2152v2_006053 [Parachlorella kessleri]